ncbi:hypothetical protein B0O80DRAFT_435938 [Mortierella sp. GBAus27b]|nr:hypothetical protein B0O80DRAFT_435938 [Mortierella sp. GBAus27b]
MFCQSRGSMRGEGEVEEVSLHTASSIFTPTSRSICFSEINSLGTCGYTKEATPALACHAIRPLHRQVYLALVVLLMEAVAVGCSRAFNVVSLEITVGLFLLAAAVFITG